MRKIDKKEMRRTVKVPVKLPSKHILALMEEGKISIPNGQAVVNQPNANHRSDDSQSEPS